MSTCKTSEAVKELAEKWALIDDNVVSRHSAKNCRAMHAIVLRFQRMQEALQTLAGLHSAPGEGDGTDSYVRSVAEEALSFDPLNE